MTSSLSPRARELLRAGREAHRPTAGERERVEALLDARLAGLAAVPPRPTGLASSKLLHAVALAAAISGAGAFVASRPPAATPKAVVSVGPVPRSSANVTENVTEQPNTPAAPSPPIVTASAIVPAARPRDRLAEEVALLGRATSELRAGRAAAALKALDEHQRRFPSGVLGVERSSARAQALCVLQRVTEGRAELARLEPQSPAAARARALCDAAAKRQDPAALP